MSSSWQRVCALFFMPILYRINERGHTFHKIKRLDINSKRFYLHMRQYFSSISANYVRFSREYVEYFVRFFDLFHLIKFYFFSKKIVYFRLCRPFLECFIEMVPTSFHSRICGNFPSLCSRHIITRNYCTSEWTLLSSFFTSLPHTKTEFGVGGVSSNPSSNTLFPQTI